MKKLYLQLFFILIGLNLLQAQNQNLEAHNIATSFDVEKHLSSSILLWMRTDKPRQESMDRWKGPHAQIIVANKGLLEYRQLHFAEENTGLWPSTEGVETNIPQDRKVDGVADVTLKNIFSIFRGKKQNKLAYTDEVNLFKRTILYAALSANSKWYNVSKSNAKSDAGTMIFFRIKDGVKLSDFKKFINNELTPTLANTGVLSELRSKVYNEWKQKQWNTPNVQHDNSEEVQFQASITLGFTDKSTMDKFFKSNELKKISKRLSLFCSAIHAYEVKETLIFVEDGKRILLFK
ncbi:strictosidine synthase [Chryseobacterium gambrini]|uniref:Strictosidine synthase n=1 Tax=Chryseobacterium gambrini TaxID=373672 RepID=A0A1N7MJU7_9FLAO|nr:strictosidine synthase [Chryseobacterium gambrini]SIS86415.1 hypothetical protein SAMN05421785_103286 [Chryseobacterium gambrini]